MFGFVRFLGNFHGLSRTRLLLVGKYEYLAEVLMRNGLKTCTTQGVLRTTDCSLI